ncbi:hypothetical protein Mapa_001662 [Marchantia paleacea]|nr:hypothetical protein Mapa_001662 [Marchantia paleacea]
MFVLRQWRDETCIKVHVILLLNFPGTRKLLPRFHSRVRHMGGLSLADDTLHHKIVVSWWSPSKYVNGLRAPPRLPSADGFLLPTKRANERERKSRWWGTCGRYHEIGPPLKRSTKCKVESF